ncbi:MAG TPA: hypothetical protein PK668_04285 [Myxococcota bacterium]|nr:hypothetical protein [Myxococcota bacterium]HRY92078.1 hypothetical protein [Myxococcota bacterium]HSA24027.1 hypothetical protein [Myxococcota bacterium]
MSALALLVAAALLAAPEAASEAEALWQAAVRLAAANRGWVAGKVVITVEQLDESGWPASSKQVVRLYPAGPGERPATRRPRSVAGTQVRTGPHPFLPEVQAGLERVALETRRSVGGVACQGFRYSFREPGGSSQTGEAWLAEEDGRPVELAYRLSPAPAGLAECQVRVRYAPAAEGAWRRASMVIEARRAGDDEDERNRATFLFQDYWRR